MNKLVMIVDDSPTVRKIVEVTLQRVGYDVVAVPDGVATPRLLLRKLPLFADLSLQRRCWKPR